MPEAIAQAKIASKIGEVPVGAVIVAKNISSGDELTLAGHNMTLSLNDPSAHAEVLVIRDLAIKLGVSRFDDFDVEIYSTLEPCLMCFALIGFSKIKRLHFGVREEKFGFINNLKNKDKGIYANIEYSYGYNEKEIESLMKEFFGR